MQTQYIDQYCRELFHAANGAGDEPPRIIALTGYGQDDDRRRSQEAGFEHHLVKPADIDLLPHTPRPPPPSSTIPPAAGRFPAQTPWP